jgi:ribosomal protein S18 acetylase RimI-like enzyme
MFKIRTPQISDFSKLEPLFQNHPLFSSLNANKFICIAQTIIPYNFRVMPSIHLAVEKEKILGFIILSSVSPSNNAWQIDDVYIQEEVRKHGIGEELVRYAISVYGGYGIEHFLVEVDSQNFPALSLFHQCGFRRYAKVHFYQKEMGAEALPVLGNEFIIRPQLNIDLNDIEKLELSIIPPDLRPALGRSKKYFKSKKDALVLIDKSRKLLIGWAQIDCIKDNDCLIEMLISPGWTHLYKPFLDTIISERLLSKTNSFKLTIKATDYNTDLSNILTESKFLPVEVKELLVRTVWQKAKEKSKQSANVGAPSIAPT